MIVLFNEPESRIITMYSKKTCPMSLLEVYHKDTGLLGSIGDFSKFTSVLYLSVIERMASIYIFRRIYEDKERERERIQVAMSLFYSRMITSIERPWIIGIQNGSIASSENDKWRQTWMESGSKLKTLIFWFTPRKLFLYIGFKAKQLNRVYWCLQIKIVGWICCMMRSLDKQLVKIYWKDWKDKSLTEAQAFYENK